MCGRRLHPTDFCSSCQVLSAACPSPCASLQGLLAELYNTKDVKEALTCVK